MVIHTVQEIFRTWQLPKALNNTFIALIPKTDHASRVDQFRPISLCNVVFKVVTKLIVDRLRGHLEAIIHPSQVAFVPNRSIGDNSIINHEVMHYLNGKQGKQGYMPLKLTSPRPMIELNGLPYYMSWLGLDFARSSVT